MGNIKSLFAVIAYYKAMWDDHDIEKVKECFSEHIHFSANAVGDPGLSFKAENREDTLGGFHHKWFIWADGENTRIKKFNIVNIGENKYRIYYNIEQRHKLHNFHSHNPKELDVLNIYQDQKVDQVIEPQVSQPQIIEPPVSQPQIIESQVSEPQVIEPRVIEPQVIEPQVIEPQVIEPQVIEPQVIEPQVSQPQVSESNNQGSSLESGGFKGKGSSSLYECEVTEYHTIVQENNKWVISDIIFTRTKKVCIDVALSTHHFE